MASAWNVAASDCSERVYFIVENVWLNPMDHRIQKLTDAGLYHPSFEKDSCGFGLIAHMDGADSHWLVRTAISSLARLTHRGAVAADGKTGDGCGLLMKKPDGFLRAIAQERGFSLDEHYAAGMVFLSHDNRLAQAARDRLTRELQ